MGVRDECSEMFGVNFALVLCSDSLNFDTPTFGVGRSDETWKPTIG